MSAQDLPGRSEHFRSGASSADRQHRPGVPTSALYRGSGIPAEGGVSQQDANQTRWIERARNLLGPTGAG